MPQSNKTVSSPFKLIDRGNIVALRNELDAGLSPDPSDEQGYSYLMHAARAGNVSIGRLLIERGASVDWQNRFGDSALSTAIFHGHLPFVKLLFENGASLNCSAFGTSLESYLNWVQQCGGQPKDRMDRIRLAFQNEYERRAVRNLD
jgi:ankyrin repeat protein